MATTAADPREGGGGEDEGGEDGGKLHNGKLWFVLNDNGWINDV